MSDPFMDKFIADLVKGAEVNSRANGGPGVNILVSRENRGREEKLANHAGLGALVGGLGLPGLGSPIGAAIGADPGQRGSAALGAMGGSMFGALGSALGASHGGQKEAAIDASYADGVRAAAAAFGVKVAFLPMLASLAGSTALRAGAGQLAKGVGGKMLQGAATKILPHMTGGLGGLATEAVGSLGGAALGQKLMPQQPQQPPQQAPVG